MALPKGRTNNPKGKPKGTLSQKTLAWERLGESIINEGAERFLKILSESDDKDFEKAYLMILEYFKPKQHRSEVNSKSEIVINWNEEIPYTPDENSSIS